MKTKFNLAVPFFPGFYNSILDDFIDREIEMEMEGDGKPGDEYYRAPQTWEEVDAKACYPCASLAIAKAWLNAFNAETGLNLEWETMTSPKEYNFQTDRVYADIDANTLAKLATAKDTPDFAEVLRAKFTSRDGFMSFYSNDVEGSEWQQPVAEWDHNQLQALLEAWLAVNGFEREYLLDSIHDTSSVYEAASEVWNKPSAEVAA